MIFCQSVSNFIQIRAFLALIIQNKKCRIRIWSKMSQNCQNLDFDYMEGVWNIIPWSVLIFCRSVSNSIQIRAFLALIIQNDKCRIRIGSKMSQNCQNLDFECGECVCNIIPWSVLLFCQSVSNFILIRAFLALIIQNEKCRIRIGSKMSQNCHNLDFDYGEGVWNIIPWSVLIFCLSVSNSIQLRAFLALIIQNEKCRIRIGSKMSEYCQNLDFDYGEGVWNIIPWSVLIFCLSVSNFIQIRAFLALIIQNEKCRIRIGSKMSQNCQNPVFDYLEGVWNIIPWSVLIFCLSVSNFIPIRAFLALNIQNEKCRIRIRSKMSQNCQNLDFDYGEGVWNIIPWSVLIFCRSVSNSIQISAFLALIIQNEKCRIRIGSKMSQNCQNLDFECGEGVCNIIP